MHRSWLRAKSALVVAEVLSGMKYPKRSQYKHAKQKKYHVRNWAEYGDGLRRRGDLTVWFEEDAIANWMADKTGESTTRIEIERWLTRRGTPHLIADYSASRDVLTRALPLLTAIFVLEMTGAQQMVDIHKGLLREHCERLGSDRQHLLALEAFDGQIVIGQLPVGR